MKLITEQINWKGIGDYVSAARTISQYGTSNTSGPCCHCRGLALELALKYFLWDKYGEYPGTHNLENLAFEKCTEIEFTPNEKISIENLNKRYVKDGDALYPARYRPVRGEVYVSMGQEILECIIEKIIQATSTPELAALILSR